VLVEGGAHEGVGQRQPYTPQAQQRGALDQQDEAEEEEGQQQRVIENQIDGTHAQEIAKLTVGQQADRGLGVVSVGQQVAASLVGEDEVGEDDEDEQENGKKRHLTDET
jgi:hypothetical protein